MTSSQRASSVQETQEASARPSSTKDAANAAAPSTSASELSLDASPHSGADSAADVQSIAAQNARGSWLTLGKGDAAKTQL